MRNIYIARRRTLGYCFGVSLIIIAVVAGLLAWQPNLFAERTQSGCSLPADYETLPQDIGLGGQWWELPGGLEILWGVYIDGRGRAGNLVVKHYKCEGRIVAGIGLRVPLDKLGFDEATIGEVATSYRLSAVVTSKTCGFESAGFRDLPSGHGGLAPTGMPLSVADNGKRLCFKLAYLGQPDLYVVSEVIDIDEPELVSIEQSGDRFSVVVDAHARSDNRHRWQFISYAPVTGYNYGHCNRDGFEKLDSRQAEAVKLKWQPYFENALPPYRSNQPEPLFVPIDEAHIGYRYCLELRTDRRGPDYSYPYRSKEYYDYAHYKLSPPIRHSQGFEPLPPSFEDRLDQTNLKAYFRRLLTPAAQKRLDEVQLIVNDYGCEGGAKVGMHNGCYLPRDEEYPGGRIYLLKGDYLPEGYGDLSEPDKKAAVKKAVKLLAHEFMHAAEDGAVSKVLSDCHSSLYRSIRATVSYEVWYGSVGIPFAWGGEGQSTFQTCLYDDPIWGEVLRALVSNEAFRPPKATIIRAGYDNLSIDYDEALRYPNGRYLPVDQDGDGDRSKLFRNIHHLGVWYVEYYAELPLAVWGLSPALEDHYAQYFEDRKSFVEVLHAPGRMW